MKRMDKKKVVQMIGYRLMLLKSKSINSSVDPQSYINYRRESQRTDANDTAQHC